MYVRAVSLAVASGGDAVDRLWFALAEDRIAMIPAVYGAAALRALMSRGRYHLPT